MLATKVDVDSIIGAELPPLPSAAMRVAALTQDLNSTSRQICDAIGTDPSLAARVLRAANSPLYAMERRVTALPSAVSLLGNNAIHLLVVISSAGAVFSKRGEAAKFERALWEHSVATALAARAISRTLGMRAVEEAFLCGLLHDIGKLLLARYDRESYAPVLECSGESEMIGEELKVFGYTHMQVGALVARRWGLPDEIAHAIHHHHQPGEAGMWVFMARIVDAADHIANAAGYGTRQLGTEEPLTGESSAALRLSEEQMAEVCETMKDGLVKMLETFD